MRPVHPGEILRDELDQVGLSANALSKALDVPVNRVTMILNGQRGVTADTALRLARYFGTTPQLWLNLQKTWELRQAEIAAGQKIAKCVTPRQSATGGRSRAGWSSTLSDSEKPGGHVRGAGELFHTHMVVDWSARSKRSPTRPTKDSIWWAVVRNGTPEVPQYVRTRNEAVKRLETLLADELRAGRRVLVGFDFPFGYPAGVAEQLAGQASALKLWGWLEELIEDEPDNNNNRFAVAEKINRNFPGIGPCWGRPAKSGCSLVPTRASDRTSRKAHPRERRICEEYAPSAKTLWQLYGRGSVGSQALLGIPALARLKAAFGAQVSVWPLDAGLETPDAPIVFAEVYPSLLKKAVEAKRDQDKIADRAQVRINALAFSRLDSRGGLAPLFEGAPGLTSAERRFVEEEEGWMLGLGHEEALLAD